MDARQAQIYSAILITSVVLGVIILFFVASVLRQQRRNLDLQRQNFLTEMNTLEKERTRMAADLHDDLGVTLSFVKFLLGSIDTDKPKDQSVLADASQRLDEAIGKVRTIAHNLMPSSLTYKGLAASLFEMIQLVNQTTAVKATLDTPRDLPLDEEQSISLFRMIQEMVQNTLKHAAANQLIIQISFTEKELLLLCEDNGRGFDPDEIADSRSKSIGLRNLQTRTDLMNGRMKLQSQKGRGTQYQFIIPLKNHHAH